MGWLGVVSCRLAGAAPDTNAATSDPLRDARFSLSLRAAPLPRMLTLLEQTTGLHFRYAAPPDTVVDTAFNNAPLLPNLAVLLRNEGFMLQRAGYEVVLYRAAGATPPTQNMPVAWSYWTVPTPPPATWVVGQPAPDARDSEPEGAWQAAKLQSVWTQSPGVAVALPPRAPNAPPDGPVWLRWPLVMRHLPTGAQLLLRTPAEADVYVNGAPLLRHWQGKRLLDLSHVLHGGLNCLALYWPHAPHAVAAPTTGAPATSAPVPVLLSYEWFFAATPVAPPASERSATPSTGEF